MLEKIEQEQNLVRRLEQISLRRSLIVVRFHDDIRFHKQNEILDATVIHVGTQKPDNSEYILFGSVNDGEDWKDKQPQKQTINPYDVVGISLEHIATIMEYMVDGVLLHIVPRLNIVLTKHNL